jgi:hypothetical protein
MRSYLQQVSPGRIFTTFLYPSEGGMTTKPKTWSQHMGQRIVDVSGAFPKVADVVLPPEKEAGINENEPSSSDDPASENDGLLDGPGHTKVKSKRNITW